MFNRLHRIARSAAWMLLLLLLPTTSAFAQGEEGEAAEQDPLVAMIVDLMGEEDASMRALAFDQVRSEDGPQGEAATLAFAAELANLETTAQARLASALGARGDAAAAPAVRELLASATDEEVRQETIGALGRLGNTSDLPAFLELIVSENESDATAASQALVYLRGDGLAEALSQAVSTADTQQAEALLGILTTRRELETIPAIQELAVGDDPVIRKAAMETLGQIGSPAEVPAMVQGILSAEAGKERDAAEKQVMFVCARIEDPDVRAQPIVDAMADLNKQDRNTLILTLGRVGGPVALVTVEESIASDDTEIHDIGIRALCRWPDSSVEGRLLELARTEPHADHARAALRALIRIAPLADDRTNQHRLDVLRTAMVMAQNDDDRKYVLQRARAIKSVETFHFVLPYMQDPTFREQACETVLDLAHDRELRGDNEEVFFPALREIVEISQEPVSVERAGLYLENKTWERDA